MSAGMNIQFKKCVAQHMKFGQIAPTANINIDLMVFALPEYFTYNEDPEIHPHLKKYEFAFHVFQIINN